MLHGDGYFADEIMRRRVSHHHHDAEMRGLAQLARGGIGWAEAMAGRMLLSGMGKHLATASKGLEDWARRIQLPLDDAKGEVG